MEPREEFLLLSFDVALQGVESGDGGPFGAVIVRGDDVLASAHNQVVATNDPTAHAEIGAIRAACASLGSFQLDIILVGHQIGRYQDAAVRQNCSQCALGERRLLLPGSKVIVRLPGNIHPNQ